MAIRFTGSDSAPALEEIAAFEARVRTRLPEELRNFLARHNGGRVEPNEFAIRDGSTRSGMIQNFLSLATLEKKWAVFKDEQQPRMPPEHIPFAKCEGGDYLTLVNDGAKRGQVFYWFHEEEGDETYTYENLYFVANSLDELIAGLT